MKRFLTLLFTTLLLTAALCVSASASDFDSAAEDLSAIGLFRGTEKGFDLDRAPTRSEAAIMLVRLYGAEDAARAAYDAGEISHPFTDVSAFTSPYVAWLYTNGITNGFTATTYASQRPCTAQNYAAFLLRALGYQDGRDFAYADTLTFAREKGFYEPTLFTGAFLRDELAAPETVNTVDPTAMDVSSLALIDSITTKAAGRNTEYTLVLGRGMDAMPDSVTGLTGTDTADLSIDSMTLTYVLDRTGTLKIMRMAFDADMTMVFRNEDGTFASIDVRYDYSIDLDAKATGKAVKITYPDLSGYPEVSPEELAGL